MNTAFSTQATRELKDLFDRKDVLDFPKPVEYIKLLVQQATTSNGNDIILDFFAGSCTTAQAVLELNREDGGNRRFIMVQLPEPLSSPVILSVAKNLIVGWLLDLSHHFLTLTKISPQR